jgi:hypothetical protein
MFVSTAIKKNIESRLMDNEIFKRDEEVMKKELEKLNMDIENITKKTTDLQLE